MTTNQTIKISQSFARALTRKQIEEIVQAAQTAPSGDNCQPWHFSSNDLELRVALDVERDRHQFNRGHRATHITWGFLTETIAIAASKHGWGVKAETVTTQATDLTRTRIPWGTLRFAPLDQPSVVDPLLPHLLTRSVDRRVFAGTAPPQEQLTRLDDFLARIAKPVCTRRIAAPTAELRAALIYSDQYMWANPLVLEDVFNWFRLKKSEVARTRDGMSRVALALGRLDAFALGLFRSRPRLLSKLWPVALKPKTVGVAAQQIDSSCGFICFAVESPTRSALEQAGRACCRTWLELHALGLVTQPLNSATLPAMDLICRDEPPGMPKEYREHYLRLPALMNASFGFPTGHVPAWLFRIGVAPKGERPLKSLRRDLSDALDFV